jgi:hypothetical protein
MWANITKVATCIHQRTNLLSFFGVDASLLHDFEKARRKTATRKNALRAFAD